MTAKDSKGKVLFEKSKIYMPVPQQLGRGDKMGRGPYEKSGLLYETSLHPKKPVIEKFEIPFPVEETKKGDKVVRNILDHEMTIEVELWYLPFGTKKNPEDAFLWHKATKKVSLEKGGL